MAILVAGNTPIAFNSGYSNVTYATQHIAKPFYGGADVSGSTFDPGKTNCCFRFDHLLNMPVVIPLDNFQRDTIWVHFDLLSAPYYHESSWPDGECNICAGAAENGHIFTISAKLSDSHSAVVSFWNPSWQNFTFQNSPLSSTHPNRVPVDICYKKTANNLRQIEIYINGGLVHSVISQSQNQFVRLRSLILGGPAISGGGASATGRIRTALFCSQIIVADEPTLGWRVWSYLPSAPGAIAQWQGSVESLKDFSPETGITTTSPGNTHLVTLEPIGNSAPTVNAFALCLNAVTAAGISPNWQSMPVYGLIRQGSASREELLSSLREGIVPKSIVFYNNANNQPWSLADLANLQVGVRT